MNKKFFTLLAASCAAMAVNAQTIYYGADGTVKNWSTDGGLTGVAEAVQGLFQAGASNTVDARFPFMPFGDNTAPSEKITKLENVDNGAESKLYQFVTDGKLLAMQWNPGTNKYQLVLIDPTKEQHFIDETLWQVTATMVNESKALRYILVNKQSQLPLQLETGMAVKSSVDANVTGSSITWTWSEIADNGANALTGALVAAVTPQHSIMLEKDGATGKLKVTKVDRTSTVSPQLSDALVFTAYEANPISLKSSEINAMLSGVMGTTVQFSMSPEIAPNVANNPLTNAKFQAYELVDNSTDLSDAEKTYKKTVKDAGIKFAYTEATDYVVLAKDNKIANMLRVDTVYHNEDIDARYELKLTTDEIEAPREAFVIGKKLSETATGIAADYKADYMPNTVIAGLQQQALFHFTYYPSTQSALIQAKQYLYKQKDAKFSWWKMLYNLGNTATANSPSFSVATLGTNFEIDHASWLGADYKLGVEPSAVTAGTAETGIAAAFTAGKNYYLPVANTTTRMTNLIKLTTLTTTPEHTEVTVGYDAQDAAAANGYKGIKTLIRIGNVFVSEEAADIQAGFYYVQNGNKVSTDLLKSGYWRYYDLAATNRTETAYNDRSGKWVIFANGNKTENPDHYTEFETPNVVYSADQLTKIPSAQWYFNGTAGAGFYTISNRESKDAMASSVYLWKVKENGVVVPNTYAMKGTVDPTHNDTIVIAPATIDPFDGYMNISEEVANADTTVFNFKFSVLGGDPVMVGANSNNILTVLNGEAIDFKVERVQIEDKDEFTGDDVVYTDDLIYGMNTTKKDTLRRALYRIYKEDVSANSTEGTGKRTREYITLDGGQYKLESYVITVDEKGYTSYDKADNAGKADNRKYFYIKNVTNTDNEFVLVDPTTTNTADSKIGVRAFVNQVSGILQPAGLKSQGASNVYDNSLFAFEKVTKYNYRDIRREGVARDTVVLFKDGNNEIKLYEASVKGANVGLLARDNKAQYTKNFALFVDTANVHNADMPIFLLGVRPSDFDETGSSLEDHNRHISTNADYLMVLTDSAAVNPAYKDIKGNIRLGFVRGTHQGRQLIMDNGKKTFDLSKKALTPASFAFRYVDKSRDAFYIETADTDGAPAWVKVINEVPVIVKDIKEAEIYNVEATSENPTANDNVTVSNVKVEATTGAVIVKNAAGLKVTVSNLLGQPIASEVLSSDNVTIAAPAGIVVVAVEGADAVKAIVK